MISTKRKEFPLEEVTSLYIQQNKTIVELAQYYTVSSTAILNFLKRNKIPRRKAHSRTPRGPQSNGWKDSVKYGALHQRLHAVKGLPNKCEVCETETALKYEWANLTGKYEDINDYKRMCKSCHQYYDHRRRVNLTDEKIVEIRNRFQAGEKVKDLSLEFKLSKSSIERIGKKIRYASVG